MTTPTIIDVSGVSKRFVLHQHKSLKERMVAFATARKYQEEFWALRDVDLQIPTGSTVGLVGHNGSGKSTLLKVIGGIIQPTTGRVQRRGRLAALLELGAGFHPDLTGRENVYLNASILGLTKAETDRYFDEIVAFSGIESFIDTQVKFYSSGMYVRLAFAVSVHVDPDLLLVDEVLAVGDEPFQRKCLAKIAEFQREGRTIVFVSHSSDQVAQLCDRVVVLDRGRMVHDGSPADGIRVLRETFEAAHAASPRVEHADGTLTTGARIDDVRVTSTSTDLSGDFTPGGDIEVVIDYTVGDVPAGWIAGIDLETPVGQGVYRVNTEGLGMELPTTPGEYSLAIRLGGSALGAGSYQLHASLVTPEGRDLDRRQPAASFSVSTERGGVGVVHFSTSAELSTS
ncbi:ABC transporter ATP-binding protein [Microcella alkalica]|uniref:ABC transporter ATP-binding protein n=1 Tax=Microcella alkalica TaxID=355930 RepID=UPI00145F0368|nr:ABC transporter ATP-binding protein [Microcella alkalica]